MPRFDNPRFNDHSNQQKAYNMSYPDCMPLVYKLAHDAAKKFKRNPKELYGVAWEGLHQAQERYNPAKGSAFVTFAHHAIYHSLRRYIIGDIRKAARRIKTTPFSSCEAAQIDRALAVPSNHVRDISDADEIDTLYRRAVLPPHYREICEEIRQGRNRKDIVAIAKRRGTTVEAIRQQWRRARNELRIAAEGMK